MLTEMQGISQKWAQKVLYAMLDMHHMTCTPKKTHIMSCYNGHPCHTGDLRKTPKFKFKPMGPKCKPTVTALPIFAS